LILKICDIILLRLEKYVLRFVRRVNAEVKVIFVGKNKELEVKGPKTVVNLAKELNITLEANVFIRNGEIVAPDDILNDEDTIEVISAVSGG